MGLVAATGTLNCHCGRIATMGELISRWESAVDPKATLSIRVVKLIDTATESSETFTLDPSLTGPNADRVILANDLIIVESCDAGGQSQAPPATTPATQASKAIAILGKPSTSGEYTRRGGVGNQGAYVLGNRPITILEALAETNMGQGGTCGRGEVTINHSDGTTYVADFKKDPQPAGC